MRLASILGTLAVASLVMACDESENHSDLSVREGALTNEVALNGTVIDGAVVVEVPNPAAAKRGERVRRAEVAIVEATTGAPLARFQLRFAAADVSEVIPVTLPASIAGVDAKVDVVFYDQNENPTTASYTLGKGDVARMDRAAPVELERTRDTPDMPKSAVLNQEVAP